MDNPNGFKILAQVSDSHDDGIDNDDEINKFGGDHDNAGEKQNVSANNGGVAAQLNNSQHQSNEVQEAEPLGSLKGVTLGQGFPSIDQNRHDDKAAAPLLGSAQSDGSSFTNKSEYMRKHQLNKIGEGQKFEINCIQNIEADMPIYPESSEEFSVRKRDEDLENGELRVLNPVS